MDTPTAVKCYQFGERAKSELIIVSQLCVALSGFTAEERAGARKMLILLMEAVRTEVQFAYNSTQKSDFNRAAGALSEAISLVESDRADDAVQKVAAAVSASTTAAMEGWQVLNQHGLL